MMSEKKGGNGQIDEEALVRLERVHKHYRLGRTLVHALRGVDLELYPGEFTALIGASGSGKSTLLNLIGGLDEPDKGRVLIEGVNMSLLDDKRRSTFRNRKLGFIFQSFNLVPVLDAYENIELPLLIDPTLSGARRRERVMSAVEDTQLERWTHHVPDQLSGGQRQRVAIARALVTRPTLVLADEPTANLDSKTAHRIIDLMLDLNRRRKVTFLFSTHDEKLMERVTRVVRIHDGMIVA